MSLTKHTLSGQVVDQQGAPIAQAIIQVRLTRPDEDTTTGESISPRRETVRADDQGVFSIDLWPNTRGDVSLYHIVARDPNTGRYVFDQTIVMPEADSDLDELTDLRHGTPGSIEAWRVTGAAMEARNQAEHTRNETETMKASVEESEQNAQQYRDQAESHKNSALEIYGNTQEMEAAVQSASDSASAAAGHKSASAGYASTAETKAGEAQNAATQAGQDKDAAQAAKVSAEDSATQAGQDKDAAAASAAAAASSEQAAEAARQQIEENLFVYVQDDAQSVTLVVGDQMVLDDTIITPYPAVQFEVPTS